MYEIFQVNVFVNIIRLVIRVNVVLVVTTEMHYRVHQMIVVNVHVQKMVHVFCTLIVILFVPIVQLDILVEGRKEYFYF